MRVGESGAIVRGPLLRRQGLSLVLLAALSLAGPISSTVARRTSTQHKQRATHHKRPAAHHKRPAPPIRCLKSAGLVHARPGSEQGTWEANAPGSQLDDHNSTVLVDGPYGGNAAAQQSAQSLQGVEYAVAGGVWVAQTTVRSQLDATVNKVARCLASTGTSPS